MQKLYFGLFFIFISGPLSSQNSVLANGEWYKIAVESDGLYKIDHTILGQLGISTNTDPFSLNLYGNSFGMLPQPNEADRPVDLLPMDIFWYGDEDNTWNPDEYFIFFAKGPDKKTWSNDKWTYDNNIYTDQSNYFIKISNEDPNRVSIFNNPQNSADVINSDVHLFPYSPEETNLLDYVGSGGSGRIWFGDLMIPSVGLVRNFAFDTPNLIDSLAIDVDLIGFSEAQTTFEVRLNQEDIGSLQVNASTVSTYSIKGRVTTQNFEVLTSGENQELTIDFIRTDGSIFGFVNQILLNYHRSLEYSGEPLLFNNAMKAEQAYNLGVSTNEELVIWRLDDPRKPKALQNSNQINDQLIFSDSANRTIEYITFDPSTVSQRPLAIGSVENQNIRALNPADGVIVTAPEFFSAAEDLAALHREKDALDIIVISTEQIYNEFSSGMQDVTAIRDAIRHYYQKSSQFRYALLFGDCSFDYKDRVLANTNFVPIYQSIDSWDPVYSYSSDDYYGFMEAEEGEWVETPSGDHTMEVGVGRLPVKSLQEANEVVNKIRTYMNLSSVPGKWKNTMTYVADDGNAGYNDTRVHMEDAEDFSGLLRSQQPQVEYNKLYIDAFEQTVTGSLEKSDAARAALKNTIEEGTFMVNFIGHGSEQRWTEENILDLEFIRLLDNPNKLPLFVTATCEFGRYDDPTLIAPKGESGAEKLVLKPTGGAIALITTTRPVFAFTNYPVNRAIHFNLLRPLTTGPETGKLPRLGDIFRLVKNNSLTGPVNRNFALLGDPMLRLNYPALDVQVTAINGNDIAEDRQDTLKALQAVEIAGQVSNHLGEIASNFNGVLQVTIYDETTEKLTLGQRDDPFAYEVRENILFQGEVSVTSGSFDFRFIMPKNISYQFGNGTISFYGFSGELGIEASGGYDQILIGGSEANPDLDDQAPVIELTMSNPGFAMGASVTRSDTLIALIADQSGINVTGLGLNRDITLTINDASFQINDRYVANLDDYQAGTIRFPLSDLAPGNYSATLNLFDIHNNEATESVDFVITDQPTIPLSAVKIYPNPAQDEFNLTFDHPRQGESLQIGLQLLTMNGSLVAEYNWTKPIGVGFSENVEVNLNTTSLQNGIYFCRMQVKSELDGATGQTVRKLIIIN